MKKRHTLQVAIATLLAASVPLTGCATGGTHRMTVERVGATPGYYGDTILEGREKETGERWQIICSTRSQYECALVKAGDQIEFTLTSQHGRRIADVRRLSVSD